MFEFQDLYGWQLVEDDYTEPTGQEYEAQVYTEDNTLDIYTYLTEIYTSAYESFYEDYYTLADDTCSYNNTDSRFNQFFIDGIEATYVGNMAEAPWIQMPIVYNIHRDLLFNTFGGDMDLIFDNAKLLSQQISPRAGTLEALEGFKDIADEINDYYTSGDINDLFETLESDSSSEAYVLTFTDFPAVYLELAEVTAEEETDDEVEAAFTNYDAGTNLINDLTDYEVEKNALTADELGTRLGVIYAALDSHVGNASSTSTPILSLIVNAWTYMELYIGGTTNLESDDWSGGHMNQGLAGGTTYGGLTFYERLDALNLHGGYAEFLTLAPSTIAYLSELFNLFSYNHDIDPGDDWPSSWEETCSMVDFFADAGFDLTSLLSDTNPCSDWY